jgi:hypothetical protein
VRLVGSKSSEQAGEGRSLIPRTRHQCLPTSPSRLRHVHGNAVELVGLDVDEERRLGPVLGIVPKRRMAGHT